MNAPEFLEALWGSPPPGFIQLWNLTDRRSEYYSTTQINLDAQPDVFTAICTTARRLGARQRAKADQTAALCGLVLDLDIKPLAFRNRTQALSFANRFARPTITVDSGYGVHAYYLFPEPWVFRQISERERAKTILQQWVALHQIEAARSGIHLDSVGDLARVLRLPGSLNAKDPADPKTVTVIEGRGPRWTYSQLARHLTTMPVVQSPCEQQRAPAAVAVDLRQDASAFGAKLDALLANSPEFSAVWTGARRFPSLSEADLSLCSLAAGAMNDAELSELIRSNRERHQDPSGKGERPSYVTRTIARARSSSQRTADAARIDALSKRAA